MTIDEARELLGLTSDNKLAKALHISRQAMSQKRKRGGPLSAQHERRVLELANANGAAHSMLTNNGNTHFS